MNPAYMNHQRKQMKTWACQACFTRWKPTDAGSVQMKVKSHEAKGIRNQSIMLSLPSNQPLRFRFCSSLKSRSLDACSSISFPVMARIRGILLFLLVFFLNGITATREKAVLPTLPKKGAAFFPPKMPVPPSGPSKQHNSVPRLPFIPATVVYGSKRLVPSGANPLLV